MTATMGGPPDRAEAASQAAAERFRWLGWTVLALALAMRLVGLTEWSLWEDEETTIYFSQHPDRPFPRIFPVFFVLLGKVFATAGISVAVGRAVALAIAMTTLWLAWVIARRFASERVALVALILIALSPAHLFWSQSIRYYGLVLLFQLASIYLLLVGMATGRLWLLLASNLALVAALKTHFSAMLLAPVYIAWFGWLLWREGPSRDLGRKALVFFGLPAIVLATFWQRAYRMLARAGDLGMGADPVYLTLTAVVYFGPVACALALVALLRRRWPSREFAFFALLAVVTIAELIVLALLDRINLSYYYGFIALVGLGVLAGYAWETIGPRKAIAALVIVTATAFHGTALVQYYGPAYGDRPRWKDAASYLREDTRRRGGEWTAYGTVPGAVAFHFGIDPRETMGHPRFRGFDDRAFKPSAQPTYYVLERRTVSHEQVEWLDRMCEPPEIFPSMFLTRDRTIAIYYCPPAAGAGR